MRTPFKLRSSGPFKMMGSSPAKAGPETKQVDVDDMGERREASAQSFENIKNDHNVNAAGIPQTAPKGYWRKAAKHGLYPTDVSEQ